MPIAQQNTSACSPHERPDRTILPDGREVRGYRKTLRVQRRPIATFREPTTSLLLAAGWVATGGTGGSRLWRRKSLGA
jgi:hypothetical protein